MAHPPTRRSLPLTDRPRPASPRSECSSVTCADTHHHLGQNVPLSYDIAAAYAGGRDRVHGGPTKVAVTMQSVIDRAVVGSPTWIGYDTGERELLPTGRWLGGPFASPADRLADRRLLRACTGPTLDVGCGPGRLTAALTEQGIGALGIDTSTAAVAMTRSRGAAATLSDVFGPVPAAGLWPHALLADGNIGIGGDPVQLLARIRALLARKATLIVEVDTTAGRGAGCQSARWETETAAGPWFPWARTNAAAVADAGAAAGMDVADVTVVGERTFLLLNCRP